MSRKYANMASESTRLRTFAAWPLKSDKCTPRALAEAGFFYHPEAEHIDRCLCYASGVTLVQWEADDVPWEQHLKLSMGCEHVQKYVARVSSGTVGGSGGKEVNVADVVRLAKERVAPNVAVADSARAKFVVAVLS